MPTTIALLLFDGCDLLDVGGPYEVLLTANRLAQRAGDPAPFAAVPVSADGAAVTAYGGLALGPTAALDAVTPVDVAVIPGTIDVAAALDDDALLAAVRWLTRDADLVTSVCTGAFLLAATGRLVARRATTHHEDLEALARRDDVGEVVAAAWVDTGDVVTAGGLSSGLALGLHLVDRLADRDLAVATAAQLAYAWDPEDPSGPTG